MSAEIESREIGRPTESGIFAFVYLFLLNYVYLIFVGFVQSYLASLNSLKHRTTEMNNTSSLAAMVRLRTVGLLETKSAPSENCWNYASGSTTK